MQITVKYETKNFFGGYECAEASAYFDIDTAKKAFAGLRKDQSFVIFIANADGRCETKFYYDSNDDFTNGIVTVQYSRSFFDHDTPVKMSFSKARKMGMNILRIAA